MPPIITIYTDGSALGNPGPGGWGAILVYGEHKKELTDGEPSTTNNRMELMGAIRALEELKFPCSVTLTTDSKYLCDAVTKGWAYSWKKKGWMRSKNEPAANPDLWERLLKLLDIHKVTFIWVKGHNGHPYNERCDELATASADRYK
jgi:ribonuclease HI